MKVKAGALTVDVHAIYEAQQYVDGDLRDTVRLVMDDLPTPQQLAALLGNAIEVEGGKTYAGYTQVVERSITLAHGPEGALVEALAAAEAAKEETAAALVEVEVKQARLQAVAEALPDEVAAGMADLYPELKGDSAAVEANKRINWQGKVAKARVAVWDRPDQWPDAAPELWDILSIQGGYREIPEVITAALAFAPDEKGWWKGELYQNTSGVTLTHNPDLYPQGWTRVQA